MSSIEVTIILNELYEKLGKPKKCNSVFLDGTSATGKSSIIASATNNCGIESNKVSRVSQITDTNSTGIGMFGYASLGLKLMRDSFIMDRSPLNCIEWNLLWGMFGEWVKTFGNAEYNPDNPDMKIVKTKFESLFRSMLNDPAYKLLRDRIYGFAVIDSDTMACDKRRARRGTGSDVRRSDFKVYTLFQNMMYTELYAPTNNLIDINWFMGRYGMEYITEAIGIFLGQHIDKSMRLSYGCRLRYPVNPNSILINALRTNAERCLVRAEQSYKKRKLDQTDIPRDQILGTMLNDGIGYDIKYQFKKCKITTPKVIKFDDVPSGIVSFTQGPSKYTIMDPPTIMDENHEEIIVDLL